LFCWILLGGRMEFCVNSIEKSSDLMECSNAGEINLSFQQPATLA
jgi:hypothetical protein